MTRIAVPVMLAVACLGVSHTAEAQLLGTHGGVGVIAASPGEGFTQGIGVGFYAKLETSPKLIGVAAEVNAIRFGSKEFPDGGSTEGETIFSAFVGPRILFPIGNAGVDVGLSTLSDGFAWGPALTFAIGTFEVGATVTFAEFGRWYGLRGGVRF